MTALQIIKAERAELADQIGRLDRAIAALEPEKTEGKPRITRITRMRIQRRTADRRPQTADRRPRSGMNHRGRETRR